MSKLNVDQKTIKGLFEDKKADFLIPDYQRPYAWQKEECITLWEDIFAFAFPEYDYSKFNRNDEYFLGPIVTFKNERDKMEVIDGQQRLTTLLLLLRAFYAKFDNMKDEKSIKTRENIGQCIWRTDEFGKPNTNDLKINSEVATDDDKEEFLKILSEGIITKEQKSNYAENYRFFQEKIEDFLSKFPSYFSYLPTRILNNCILLPIEAESQDSALQIFSTLNDRGKPLSDADIFKAQLYKFYTVKGEKNQFIEKWKKLTDVCEKIFHPITGTPMDELFTRYMYYERAKMGIKSSTTEALRKFYERDSYKLLKQETTFENLITLADFWNDVANQNAERFSDKVLCKLFVLNYAPNGMWTNFVSVYFMQNKDCDCLLDNEQFFFFLEKSIAFIWMYTIINPGVNALRTPVYTEMINIVEEKQVDFADYKVDIPIFESMFNNFNFTNNRPITKSMLTWWTFNNDTQGLLPIDAAIEIEHIFPRNRQDKEKSLLRVENLESLGNKSILEKHINIRASDYKFSDKKKYYQGYTTSKNQKIEGTKVQELVDIAKIKMDFNEADIENRTRDITGGFLTFLRKNELEK